MADTSVEGFPLSPQQRHLWRLQRAEARAPYLAFSSILIEGPAEPEILMRAWSRVIDRHEMLRTGFHSLSGMRYPIQKVKAIAPSPCARASLAYLERSEREDRLNQLVRSFTTAETEMFDGTALRGLLVDIEPTLHLLLLSMPALCADTISLELLARELSVSYAAELDVAVAAETSVQYAEAAAVFNDLLESPEARVGREFWLKKSNPEELISVLPFENTMPDPGFRPEMIPVRIDPAIVSRLGETIASGSLSTVLLAGWKVLLWKLTRESKVVIGTVYDGRTFEELGQTLGLFARHLPVRSQLHADQDWTEFLSQARHSVAELTEWQDYFDWEYLAVSDQSRRLGFFPFCFEFHQASAPSTAAGVVFRPERCNSFFDRFKMKLSARSDGENLAVSLYFDSSLYQIEEMRCVAKYYSNVLASLASTPRRRLGSIHLIDQQEVRQALLDLNPVSTATTAEDACLHTLVENQVARTPAAKAITDGSDELTYFELNTRANRLAHHLRRSGVGPEQMIGICVERSIAMVVTMLGVLKSGAAYVALDPTHPEGRLSVIIEEAGLSLILADTMSAEKLSQYRDKVFLVNIPHPSIEANPGDNPEVPMHGDHAAYVLHTSGSTGSPKGVVVPHSAVRQRLMGDPVVRELASSDRVLQIASSCFDFSVWEIFAPLVAGAQLVLAPPSPHAIGPDLVRFIAEHRITVAHFIPSLLHTFLDTGALVQCGSLRMVLCGGEPLDPSLLNRLLERIPATVLNQYGPTEACIDATAHTCLPTPLNTLVPIGRPFSHVRVYAVDPQLEITPSKLPGELYIGGSGLARGYLRRSDLTAEVFLPDPWSITPGSRMYKTGDLVRYLPSGEFEFLGRTDQQVKIRGFRVELGEVEAVLNEHPSVLRAVVVARQHQEMDRQLVAYLIPTRSSIDADGLRFYARQRLPEFMVPGTFVSIDMLPLTPTGKIDRAALPEPDRSFARAQAYIEPTGSIEQALAAVWRELLGTERIGASDNFFDVGGHSLLMVQMQGRIRTQLGYDLSMVDLFQYPTISALAQRLATDSGLANTIDQTDDRRATREMSKERLTRSREARQAARAKRDNATGN